MKGLRKVLIGLSYLAVAPGLVYLTGSIEGVAAVMATTAAGVAAIVYGNVQEHRFNGRGGST